MAWNRESWGRRSFLEIVHAKVLVLEGFQLGDGQHVVVVVLLLFLLLPGGILMVVDTITLGHAG
jgi:hypothetical protein